MGKPFPDPRGRVSARAGVPPHALAVPEAAGRPRRSGRRPRWARVLVALGALLIVVSAAGIAGSRVLLHRYTDSIGQQSLLGDAGTPHVSIDGPINLLLVGIDERNDDPDSDRNADSILIVHIPASHDAAYLASVPRDSYVSIPSYSKSRFEGGSDKINAAFPDGYGNGAGRAGGFELLALTIKKLTGISFNGGAIVDFSGFKSLVAALGGVNMCVDERTVSVHIGHDARGRYQMPYELTDEGPVPVPGVTPQVYQPGCQHLADWQALDYVRQRELLPDGDYGRQRHQQQFLKAVLKQATGSGMLTNPVKLDRVLRAAGQAMTVDNGGISIPDWLFALRDIRSGAVTMLKTNGGTFNSELIDGKDTEILSDTSLKLFSAIRDDNVPAFVAAHPDWVSPDSA
ncbi:LCP family protein [Dactylosporangium sp. CA-139066]|uniref:LCP family protein n=1 Tax=Dactylosporangium sp. CA-139066 TaxID=3239930 RepID=UPI003D8BEBE5